MHWTALPFDLCFVFVFVFVFVCVFLFVFFCLFCVCFQKKNFSSLTAVRNCAAIVSSISVVVVVVVAVD